MPFIKHVFVLILENRSFDDMLGLPGSREVITPPGNRRVNVRRRQNRLIWWRFEKSLEQYTQGKLSSGCERSTAS